MPRPPGCSSSSLHRALGRPTPRMGVDTVLLQTRETGGWITSSGDRSALGHCVRPSPLLDARQSSNGKGRSVPIRPTGISACQKTGALPAQVRSRDHVAYPRSRSGFAGRVCAGAVPGRLARQDKRFWSAQPRFESSPGSQGRGPWARSSVRASSHRPAVPLCNHQTTLRHGSHNVRRHGVTSVFQTPLLGEI